MKRIIFAAWIGSLLASMGCSRMSTLQFGGVGGISSNRFACTVSSVRSTETVPMDGSGNMVGVGPVFDLSVQASVSGVNTNSMVIRVESNRSFQVLSGVPSGVGSAHTISYRADSIGTHSVVATVLDPRDNLTHAVCSKSLTVQGVAGTLQSISLSPEPSNLPLAIFADFTATGHYSDGSTQDITDSVTWTSSYAPVAEFSAATPGRLLLIAEGTTTITAALGNVSQVKVLGIDPATLQSLAVVPLVTEIPLGRNIQLIATGVYSDGSTVVLTNAVTWNSAHPNFATISNSGQRGLVTSHAQGTAAITASLQGVTSNVAFVNVGAPVLQALSISQTSIQVEVGSTIQVNAVGSLSDGSTANLTQLVQWGKSNNRININANGVVTGVSAGDVTITASYLGYTASRAATVTQTVLNSISVSPSNPTLDVNQSTALVATGHYSDGSTANLTSQVNWSSSHTAIATVGNSGAAKGTTVGQSEGVATITATLDGKSGSASVTVQSYQLYFVFTRKGDWSGSLNDIVGTNHPFSNFNFKQNQFKIRISTRLLSRINYAGKQSYELSDMDLRQSHSSYAEIYRINRNVADRSTGSGSCTLVPESVFERHRFDSSSLTGGSYLNLSSGSGNQYIYEHEGRERYAVGNQGCYPSVHSGRKDGWGAAIAAPNFSQSPWPADPWYNTYGNGAFVYVTNGGELRFWYKTQQQAGRVVFLIAIKSH